MQRRRRRGTSLNLKSSKVRGDARIVELIPSLIILKKNNGQVPYLMSSYPPSIDPLQAEAPAAFLDATRNNHPPRRRGCRKPPPAALPNQATNFPVVLPACNTPPIQPANDDAPTAQANHEGTEDTKSVEHTGRLPRAPPRLDSTPVAAAPRFHPGRRRPRSIGKTRGKNRCGWLSSWVAPKPTTIIIPRKTVGVNDK
jgi:hypothetical protein